MEDMASNNFNSPNLITFNLAVYIFHFLVLPFRISFMLNSRNAIVWRKKDGITSQRWKLYDKDVLPFIYQLDNVTFIFSFISQLNNIDISLLVFYLFLN